MARSSLMSSLVPVVAIWLALSSMGNAQIETILHVFSGAGDGNEPEGGLILGTNGNFYGTTRNGGSTGEGCVFEVTPAGAVTVLHSFGTIFADGYYPYAAVTQATDGCLYGTTTGGGGNGGGNGSVFKISPHGVYTKLHSFGDGSVANDGSNPNTALVEGGDGNFYGTTPGGGSASAGTVYKITPEGVVTILHSFGDGTVTHDGSTPQGALVLGSDGNFYGTTNGGGSAGQGTVYKMTPLGAVTILHNFLDGSVANDGQNPRAGLIQGTDGNFYGTTQLGGSQSGTIGAGCIFKITPQGAVTILHSFDGGGTLNDGDQPLGALLQGPDGSFYGMTSAGGGTAGQGILFQLNPLGHYAVLHTFADGSVPNDGEQPDSALVMGPDGRLYGMTPYEQTSGNGNIFAFTLPPATPVLTSPASATGNVDVPFKYQVTATNLPTHYSASNLPDGLSIDANSGLISGTPTTVETNTVTLTIANAIGSNDSTLSIAIAALPVPVLTSAPFAYGSAGAAFTYTITASHNPTSFSATGLTGTGLSIDTSTGVISGTPSGAETISASITATNATGASSAFSLAINILAAPPTLSQEYNVVHRFMDGTVTNDGSQPQALVQGFDGNYYGVAIYGGSANQGAIFKMSESGVISIIYSFSAASGIENPTSLLQAADGSFYGATNHGQIFRYRLDGELTIIHTFGLNALGYAIQPNSLIQGYDGNFYGTTVNDGISGAVAGQGNCYGTIFKITPQGAFTLLHKFNDGSVANDGIEPQSGLVQGTDGNFYGTTRFGGTQGDGTAYEITPQGTLSILHSFGVTVTDGQQPYGALVQATDGNFYGTTEHGGSSTSGDGSVFRMTPSGTVTILHGFNDGSIANDGEFPVAGLIQGFDGNFYGTTLNGASTSYYGTVFQITPQGAITILHVFSDGSVTHDGTNPAFPLIQGADGNFYGLASGGGNPNNYGIIYSITAQQTPTHVPIYTGSAYQEASVLAPFSFTPKAFFGVSGSGATNQGNAVPAPGSGGIMDALVSLVAQQTIHKNFATTTWALNEQGVGSVPPNTLQPLNLTFDPTSGTIIGTPIQGGTYTLTMTPSNNVGAGSPQTVTIYIDVPPGINSAVSVSTPVAQPFSYQIESTPPAISYGASYLPGFLTANSTTGIIAGTPPAAGTYFFDAIAANLSGQAVQPVTLTVTGGSASLPAITSATTANAAVGAAFNYQIATSPAATSFTALDLPGGLIFDEPTGTIFGVPNQTGTFQIPLTAANPSGSYAAVLTLTIAPASVPVIPATLTANAAVNAAFSYAIPATGVVSSYAESGALPAGLSFNAATGVISGTPTATGTFPLILTVTNTTGAASSVLTLNVQNATTYGNWTTTNGVSGGANGAPYHDAVPNLLKYLCDINPDAAMSSVDRAALPNAGEAIIAGTDSQTMTFRQSALAGGLKISVQTSPDLKSWSTIATEPSSSIVQVGTDPATGDPIYQAQVPFTSEPQFIRLNVAQP